MLIFFWTFVIHHSSTSAYYVAGTLTFLVSDSCFWGVRAKLFFVRSKTHLVPVVHCSVDILIRKISLDPNGLHGQGAIKN